MTYRERKKLFDELTTLMDRRAWPEAVACADRLRAGGLADRRMYEAVLAAYIDSGLAGAGGSAASSLCDAITDYAARFPHDGVSHFYQGRAALLAGDSRAAEQHFRTALQDASMPAWYRGATYSIYATLCRELGDAEQAAKLYLASAKYKDLAHGQASEYSNYLFNLHYLDRPQDEMLAAAKGYGDLFCGVQQYTHDRARHRRHKKIRVGYISPDLHFHVVAFFSYAFLRNYDHSRFEVYCYTNCVEDAASREFAAMVDTWRNVRGLTDAQAAEVADHDEIDILFDLSGHTGWGFLPALARKPAPIQVSGIGWFDTTGLPAVDYFLADGYTDPVDVDGTPNDAYFTEKLLRLPHSHFCFMWHDNPPPVAPAPFLGNGFVTFGSFNNFTKVSDRVLRLWAQILARVPQSRLYLKAKIFGDAYGREKALARIEAAGIDRTRVRYETTEAKYLAHYADMDIALDTYPYPGGGTTCDALYMGVPVVTLVGARHNARFGYSLLMNVGLGELCAFSPEEYIERAVALAGDAPRLQRYHLTLRRQMRRSPVMQAEDYMGDVERLYEKIYHAWLGEEMPERMPAEWTAEALRRAAAFVQNPQQHGLHARWFLQEARKRDPAHTPELLRALADVCRVTKRFAEGFAAARAAEAALQEKHGTCAIPKDNEGARAFRASLHAIGAKCALESGHAEAAVPRYRQAAQEATNDRDRLAMASAALLAAHAYETDPMTEQKAHLGYAAFLPPKIQPFQAFPQFGKHERIRVGYLSPDFRHHVMFAFYYALLIGHDATQFEIFLYSLGRTHDGFTELAKQAADAFVDLAGKHYEDIAKRIHDDGIDILVDLAGHTTHSGLPVLAYRPAPVQVSGLGYMAATGLPQVDYFLTDSAADPTPDGAYWAAFHEEPVVLTSQFCYTGRSDVPQPKGAPCKRNGFVTFGVFHRYQKWTDEMIRLWADIMRTVPTARLLLKCEALGDDGTAAEAFDRLASCGLDMNRVQFEGADERYMERMMDVDVMLDTYPYAGGGITCDALFMGVPVVTRYGRTRGSRFGLSILSAAGLAELAAPDAQNYVARAVSLAQDAETLDALHHGLRAMMMQSRLMDVEAYCREVETAYRLMNVQVVEGDVDHG